MKKILGQEEIDALFRGARAARPSPASAAGVTYTKCNFRQAGQINKEQARTVSALHEGFAGSVSNSLGAFLRVAFDVNLVSVEQLTYSEFISGLPDVNYLASISIVPLDATALIQLDLSLAFPVIDLVLGGLGKGDTESRAMTEIEDQVIESVLRIICRELEAAWSPILDLEFRFDRQQLPSQVTGLLSSSERVLVLSFEIRLPEAHGMLTLAFPALVSNTLLRKLATQWTATKRAAASQNRSRLRERLQDALFPTELCLAPSPVRIEELLALHPGGVLVMRQRVAEPVRLLVSGKNMFLASPVSFGKRRGAQIVESLSLAEQALKE